MRPATAEDIAELPDTDVREERLWCFGDMRQPLPRFGNNRLVGLALLR